MREVICPQATNNTAKDDPTCRGFLAAIVLIVFDQRSSFWLSLTFDYLRLPGYYEDGVPARCMRNPLEARTLPHRTRAVLIQLALALRCLPSPAECMDMRRGVQPSSPGRESHHLPR